MDFKVAITVLFLFMYHLIGLESANMEMSFLNKLLVKIPRRKAVSTLFILKHHEDRDCALQNWNHPEIPSLRFDNRAGVQVRKYFNHLSLALVCISRQSDVELLQALAQDFNNMRQNPIILWMQTSITEDVLRTICELVEEYQFERMLILKRKDDDQSGRRPDLVLRLKAHPKPHFEKVKRILGKGGYFFSPKETNYEGRIMHVLPDWSAEPLINVSIALNRTIPLIHIHDRKIIDFAQKYNLTLKVMGRNNNNSSEKTAIRLDSRMESQNTDLRYLNPYDISSLTIVVPCGRKRTMSEVLRSLDFKNWLLYLLPVYVAFVIAEILILKISYRIRGNAYRVSNIDHLINLRAFGAIWGLPFHVPRSLTLSMKQLFLTISIFGFIFSSFCGCKLKALLTDPFNSPQIDSFEELNASDLNVIVTPLVRKYLDSEVGPDFLKRNLTKVVEVGQAEKTRMILSLNDSNAYIMFTKTVLILESYQRSVGRKVLCSIPGLTIVQSIPLKYIKQNNSRIDGNLVDFLMGFHESGLINHLINHSPYYLKKALNMTMRWSSNRNPSPLCIRDLMCLWIILGCGHAVAILVFIIELLLKPTQERRSRRIGMVSEA
ncbi:hypothetical protein KR074_012195 [Drosophila pseudoananassae]|nr:hypothetical protein KR074_012195 [Drosophila pseudoananassae]